MKKLSRPAFTRAIVSLGSNLEPRATYLAKAVRALARLPMTRLVKTSSVLETDPVDVPKEFAGLKFLNQIAVLETSLTAEDFSRRMHAIEDRLGRVRTVRNGPRTIDLDLIDFGGLVRRDPALTLPHPRAHARDFVLKPLAELGIALDFHTPRAWLVWLNWPVGAFRLDATSLKAFRARVMRPGDTVRVVRSERGFLKALPAATHAVVWEFKKAWFARAPKLRVLATPGAGRELLPTDAELPPGVVRVNGAFHGRIMSETVVAFVFAHARGLYAAEDFQRRGVVWPRGEMSPFCSLVAGTRAVVLGYGKIGHAIADKLEALGVTVTGIRRCNIADLKPACRTADWLIVALPSDTGTDDLVNAAVLRSLPRRAVLINVGRGNAVDEKALVAALKAHRLAAAYLDVFKHEPLTADEPLAGTVPNLHRLPHASAFAPEYLPFFFEELAKA